MSVAEERPEPTPGLHLAARAYEWAVAIPIIFWVTSTFIRTPDQSLQPMLLLWAVAISLVDLMPVPASIELRFSLSFPLQLAVALIYPTPIATAIALIGTSDMREIRREIPLAKAMFNRAQIAASVAAESFLFHSAATLRSSWPQVLAVVMSATVIGYLLNVALVALDFHLESRAPLSRILRQMHVGVFGEFVLSYMGLALFGVMVATSFSKVGIWSIGVFVAPLIFARQMFLRTHSLTIATRELEHQRQEQEWQALHDPLTGLPNRKLFHQRVREAIEGAAGQGASVAVMIMDLNDFKEVNDTLGHHAGDLVLEQIGRRMQQVLRDDDLIARLGGDEFGVVLPHVKDEAAAVSVAERLLEALEPPISLEGMDVDLSASIGVSIYPWHGDDAQTLLRRADVAMYAAKESRGTFEVYSPSRDRYAPGRFSLITQIRPALENDELLLHYQPKVDLATGAVSGVEALIRWQHPEHGLVMPASFIPFVERTVLIRPITHYVLDTALRQWHRWARQGLDVRIAVNLSARSLLDAKLPEQIAELLARWKVPPDRLVLELTESSLMAESARAMSVMTRLSALGLSLSVDDFGTGYSSLTHLKRLPIDEIKIDRSFVMHMQADSGDAMIVRATVDLGRNLGLLVVAEGVEDRATWEQLAAMGCDVAQGHFITPPLDAAAMTAWLLEHGAAGRARPPRPQPRRSPVRIHPASPLRTR